MVNKLANFCKKATLVGLAAAMPFGVFAGPKDDGIKAYKEKKYEVALEKFKEAQAVGEIPKNNQWNTTISKLENYVAANRPKDTLTGDLLFWSNVASLIGAGYFGYTSFTKLSEYDKLYKEIDNTNEANRQKLLDMRDGMTFDNMGLAATGALSFILTLYNLTDKNGWLNRTFSTQAYDPKIKGPSVTIKKEF